jgi:predicted ester cyclase
MRFWQGAGLAGFMDLHDPGFIDHSSAGRPTDRDGFRAGIEGLYRAFPDFDATIEAMVVDDIRAQVAIRWSAIGHMRGAFLEMPPSGRRIAFCGIEIIAVRDGRVIERWGAWDEAATREQIGLR